MIDSQPVTILDAGGNPIKLINAAPNMQPFAVNPFAFPQLANYPNSPQISNVNGMYDNMRWYLVTNFWQLLSQAYCEIGLIKTITQIPVDDALRGGCEIQTKELDEDDIQLLMNRMEEKQDFVVLKETGYWDRLFGGSFTMPMFDDQDPEEPLDLSKINENSNCEFRAGDLWELFWDYSQTMEYDYGKPFGEWDFEYFSYWGNQVHKSRIWRMTGIKAPSYIRPRLRGWGLSVIEELVREMNRFLKTQDVLFEILDDSKIDVFQFEGLIDSLFTPNAQNNKKNIAARAEAANGRKNYLKTMVLDAKDSFTQRQLSFSGFSDIGAENRIELSCALRIPMTKLWGQSPAGFSDGEGDQENYNGMIESEIRPVLKRNLIWMVKIRCMECFGFIPADLRVNFKSLRVLSSTDEENIKTSKHSRLLSTWQAGGIGRSQFLEACNRDNLFPMKMETTKINPNDMPMNMGMGGENKKVEDKAGAGKIPHKQA